MNNETLIQSYVKNKYFVSTINRQSSAMIENPPFYYETIIWEWDVETRKRGKIINMEDSGRFEDSAMKRHFGICKSLSKG